MNARTIHTLCKQIRHSIEAIENLAGEPAITHPTPRAQKIAPGLLEWARRQRTAWAISQVPATFGSINQVRRTLNDLVAAQALVRTGDRRTTRYEVA